MANLVVSTFIGNGSLWLYLDNKLIATDSDSVTVELEEGIEYIVHWFVRGASGSSYSITISSPREAQYQLTRVVGQIGKQYGGMQFIV
jgi:hypothetical protein